MKISQSAFLKRSPRSKRIESTPANNFFSLGYKNSKVAAIIPINEKNSTTHHTVHGHQATEGAKQNPERKQTRFFIILYALLFIIVRTSVVKWHVVNCCSVLFLVCGDMIRYDVIPRQTDRQEGRQEVRICYALGGFFCLVFASAVCAR